jgi:hypothetical protein
LLAGNLVEVYLISNECTRSLTSRREIKVVG